MILIVLIFTDKTYLNNITNILENFGGYQMFQQFVPFNTYKFPTTGWFWNSIPTFNGYTDLPWNNMQLGTTHNMSYDIRGDPLVIPRTTISPWNNPEVYPIYNNAGGVLY